MDQNQETINQEVIDNQPTVDNDLQKAIDDITNKTNIDPVFSDPVAAPSSVPEGDTGELGEPVGPFPDPKLEMVAPAPEQIAPLEPIEVPELAAPAPEPAPEPTITPPLMTEPAPAPIIETAPATGLNAHQIKEAALRDLLPLLDRLNMDPSQKFNLYRNIFEDLHDYTILEPAYHAAKEIANENERAEALLFLVQSIDKM